jgi:FAD:protein FMN transferase
MTGPEHSRRDLFTGEALRREVVARQDEVADGVAAGLAGTESLLPGCGETVVLSTVAMACDVEVILPAGPEAPIAAASTALDLVSELEGLISVYRDDSALVRVNRAAQAGWTPVEPEVYALLDQARACAREFGGAFDPTAGPLVALWRQCRREQRLPTADELAATLRLVGEDVVEWDAGRLAIRFRRVGAALNLNAFGKGAALDRAGDHLSGVGVRDFCLHAGHSSVLARGLSTGTVPQLVDAKPAEIATGGQGGWTIGLRNPLLAHQRYARLRLTNGGLSTSGNGVQYFTVNGTRYGHLLDPRTGWPANELLAVSVVAGTAARAEALSTAFFVLGVEKACGYCHNDRSAGAILVPPPRGGRLLAPVVVGLSRDAVEFEPDSVSRVDWRE